MMAQWIPFFRCTYQGSLYGAGPVVHSVFPNVLTRIYPTGRAILNPQKIADEIGGLTKEQVQEALDFLCGPDENSKSSAHNGARLLRVGPMEYEAVNFEHYQSLARYQLKKDYDRRYSAAKRAATIDSSYEIVQSRTESPEIVHKRREEKSIEGGGDEDSSGSGNKKATKGDDKAAAAGGKPPKNQKFSPPTIEETVAYFEEKGEGRDEAERFWFHHDTRGWLLKGGAKMKNWHSAVGTWLKHKGDWAPASPKPAKPGFYLGDIPKEDLEAFRGVMGRLPGDWADFNAWKKSTKDVPF